MKGNMFVKGAPMRCPKGTAARVRSWRRDIVRARAQFHFSPTRQRLVVRVAVRVRTYVCACGSVVGWLAGCWPAGCLAAWLPGCWLLAVAGGCCLLSAACCLLPAVCCLRLLCAACCVPVFAPAPASAGPARNGIWMKMRASTMSLRQLRTRAAVPFGHRIGAPLTNMLRAPHWCSFYKHVALHLAPPIILKSWKGKVRQAHVRMF